MSVKSKKTAIVTGGTKNEFAAMAVLALNIKEKCPNIADELIILHDGISEHEQKKVAEIFPTRFIKWESPFASSDNFSEGIEHYFSFMLFCRYECWHFLEEYSTVIWTDYDIVILDNIEELKVKQNACAKFAPSPLIARNFTNDFFFNFSEDLKTFDVLADGICGGLFVLYDDFPNYNQFYEKLIEYTLRYKKVTITPDQAVVAILLQQNNIVYDPIDPNVYITLPKEYDKLKAVSKILHAAGQPKFWNGLYNEQWNAYYQKWTGEYHGMPYKKKRKSLKRVIKWFLPHGLVKVLERKGL